MYGFILLYIYIYIFYLLKILHCRCFKGNRELLPSIRMCAMIAISLPATTCSVERSFRYIIIVFIKKSGTFLLHETTMIFDNITILLFKTTKMVLSCYTRLRLFSRLPPLYKTTVIVLWNISILLSMTTKFFYTLSYYHRLP
jgi:hypothetical protein